MILAYFDLLLKVDLLTNGNDIFSCVMFCFCRIGLRSLVLESSESLRVTGYAITTWTNAWKALDALGMSIGDYLRQQHAQIQGYESY